MAGSRKRARSKKGGVIFSTAPPTEQPWNTFIFKEKHIGRTEGQRKEAYEYGKTPHATRLAALGKLAGDHGLVSFKDKLSNSQKGGGLRARKRQKGGAVINGHLVSKVSHKTRSPHTVYDAAKDTFLDPAANPLPAQKRHQMKGVLNDELSTNLHMKR